MTKPAYAMPLVANLTGSIWFFLLVGQAGELCYPSIDGLKHRAWESVGGDVLTFYDRVVIDGSNYEFTRISLHGAW